MTKSGPDQEDDQVHPVGGILELQCRFHGPGFFARTSQHIDTRLDHPGIHFVGKLTLVNQVVRVSLHLPAHVLPLHRKNFDGAILVEHTMVPVFKNPERHRILFVPADQADIVTFYQASPIAYEQNDIPPHFTRTGIILEEPAAFFAIDKRKVLFFLDARVLAFLRIGFHNLETPVVCVRKPPFAHFV